MSKTWNIVHAVELCGENIGDQVRVRTWDNSTEIAVVHTGELRQISHDGGAVHLRVGVGAPLEIACFRDQPVTLNPPADFSDMTELSRYDERV